MTQLELVFPNEKTWRVVARADGEIQHYDVVTEAWWQALNAVRSALQSNTALVLVVDNKSEPEKSKSFTHTPSPGPLVA